LAAMEKNQKENGGKERYLRVKRRGAHAVNTPPFKKRRRKSWKKTGEGSAENRKKRRWR